MFTCIQSIRTTNGELYKYGETISDHRYHTLTYAEKNCFRKKPDDAPNYASGGSNDDSVFTPSVIPDSPSPSFDSPSFDSSSNDSSSDFGCGGDFGGGGSSDSW